MKQVEFYLTNTVTISEDANLAAEGRGGVALCVYQTRLSKGNVTT